MCKCIPTRKSLEQVDRKAHGGKSKDGGVCTPILIEPKKKKEVGNQRDESMCNSSKKGRPLSSMPETRADQSDTSRTVARGTRHSTESIHTDPGSSTLVGTACSCTWMDPCVAPT